MGRLVAGWSGAWAGRAGYGWREADYSVRLTSELRLLPFAAAGETKAQSRVSEVGATSYLVDN
ncbi:MAG: hypothetical protein LC799_27610, partial [Actinobacteria bacterium]|nr:hypothetical protein [Actinomycetota bacterium]